MNPGAKYYILNDTNAFNEVDYEAALRNATLAGVMVGAGHFAEGMISRNTATPRNEDLYDGDVYTGGRTEQELKSLAEDPAHYGSTREIDILKGEHEAKIGLDLEERGALKSIRRDPTGKAEFIDEYGQAWDVKSFNSNYKPNKGGFRLDKALKTIRTSLGEGEKVIVDTTNMSYEHISELKAAITSLGMDNDVIYWP